MHFSSQMTAVYISVSMPQLLLLTAVTQTVVALTPNTLTTDQLHTVLCVWTVAHRHFAPGKPLVVSLPRTTPDVARSQPPETRIGRVGNKKVTSKCDYKY